MKVSWSCRWRTHIQLDVTRHDKRRAIIFRIIGEKFSLSGASPTVIKAVTSSSLHRPKTVCCADDDTTGGKNNKFMEIWIEWNEMCQRFPITYVFRAVCPRWWWDWNSTRIPFHSISPSILLPSQPPGAEQFFYDFCLYIFCTKQSHLLPSRRQQSFK